MALERLSGTGVRLVFVMMLFAFDSGTGLYPNPGFPSYESPIQYLGGTAVPYRYLPTSQSFAIDLDQVRRVDHP